MKDDSRLVVGGGDAVLQVWALTFTEPADKGERGARVYLSTFNLGLVFRDHVKCSYSLVDVLVGLLCWQLKFIYLGYHE